MIFSDITPAGAYVNAIRAADERDRQERSRPARVAAEAAPRPRLALSQAVTRIVKSAAGLRDVVSFRSRTA